jgi:hypothetical protein
MILSAFGKFAGEAAIVGRLLISYTVLELDLLNCVQMGVGNFDSMLKGMFQKRGEKRRIDAAEALGTPIYQNLNLGTDFAGAIKAMRHCRLIRNQHAHANWWDDYSGQFAFANLEDAAKTTTIVTDLLNLFPNHVDVPLLQAQEAFYVYTDGLLAFVNYEGRKRANKPTGPVAKPAFMAPPPLHL